MILVNTAKKITQKNLTKIDKEYESLLLYQRGI